MKESPPAIGTGFVLKANGLAFSQISIDWLPIVAGEIRSEVECNKDAWLVEMGRQRTIEVQRHTQSIFLRRGVRVRDDVCSLNDIQESEIAATAELFPTVMDALSRLAAHLGGRLGRAMLVRLAPQSEVYPHIDEGAYYRERDRYHYVIDSPCGSHLTAGGETVTMRTGELWWFDNKRLHSSRNESVDWRIHLIFDLLPRSKSLVHRPGGQLLLKPDIAAVLFSQIRARCIRRSPPERLVSAGGKPQRWLIDLRPILLDGACLEQIADAFWMQFADEMPFQVAGMEVAAIPLMTAIQLKALSLGLSVNACIIRKQRKQYGTGQRIEGTLTDAPIVLIDDVVNSGASLEKAYVALEDRAADVARIFTVVDFQSSSGLVWRRRRCVQVDSLLHPHALDLPPVRMSKRAPLPWRSAWRFGGGTGDPFHMVPKSAPVLDGDSLYFGDDAGVLRCLGSGRGTENWRFEVRAAGRKGIWSTCALDANRLYFGAYNGRLYCLDKHTGTQVWANHVCEWIGSSPLVIARHKMLLIGLEYERAGARGSIAAFDLEDGRKLWEHWLPEYQHGSGCYSVELDLVVFGTNSDSVVALHPNTGALRWTLAMKGPVKSAPAIDPLLGLVAIAGFDHSIHIIDLDTGAQMAAVPTDGICNTTPLFLGDLLFCGSSDRAMHVIDVRAGREVHRVNVGARVFSPPRRLGDSVIFGTTAGNVILLDPATFSHTVVAQVPDAITNAIAVEYGGNRIYVPTYTNQVHAFDVGPIDT